MIEFLIKKITLSLFLMAFTAMPAVYAQQQQPSVAGLSSAKSSVFRSAEKRRQYNAETFIRTELFFGRRKPDGTEVSQEEFADFLNATVTPAFPDGLTVLDGIGQFRGADGRIVQEKAKVLILLYPAQIRRLSSQKIERIRNAYKNRFQQQSVLRVDGILPVKVSF